MIYRRASFAFASFFALGLSTQAQIGPGQPGTSPQVRCQSHIPFVVPSSGSMGNNGALTFATALPVVYGNAYVQLPANAIQAGSAAGWYFASFTGVAAATVYQETYAGGNPVIPTSPTPWVSTGPGPYTQSNGTINGPNCVIPGGLLGTNGSIQVIGSESHNNSGGNKTVVGSFGGYSFGTTTQTATSQIGFSGGVSNSGATNKQVPLQSAGNWAAQSSTLTVALGSIDTTVNKTAQIQTVMNTPATDYQIITNVIFIFIPGN